MSDDRQHDELIRAIRSIDNDGCLALVVILLFLIFLRMGSAIFALNRIAEALQ